MSWNSFSFYFFPTSRIMQLWVISVSKVSLLPNCPRDSTVCCRYGLLFVSQWMRSSLLLLLKTKLDVGEPLPLFFQHRDLGFVLCAKHMLFSLKSTAAVFSLLPSVCTIWSLLLWCRALHLICDSAIQLSPAFSENELCIFVSCSFCP